MQLERSHTTLASVSAGETATQPGAPESRVAPARLALHFVYPPELSNLVVPISHGMELGRGPWDDLPTKQQGTVPHTTVSRRHASISFGFGSLILKDLGSTNGTRVDGANLEGATSLTVQTVVRLGDTLAVVDTPADPSDWVPPSLPGQSAEIVRLRDLLRRAAPEPSPVLIQGETGTGKELLAADVHRLSGRSGPYLKLNCAELSPQLIESQLFGHEKGAFTGATAAHTGLFVAAQGGTLFLDEIGELPLALQAKLLRVLQDGEVRPVGAVQTRKTDVRVVSATNRNLADDVEHGRFRRDLYARLGFFELRLPPLRERRRDLLQWIDLLCGVWGRARNKTARLELQPAVAERLLLHTWPDNLRGVDRFVHRVLSIDDTITVGMRALAEALPELAGEPNSSGQKATVPSERALEPADGPAGSEAAANATSGRASLPPIPTKEEFLRVYEATGRNVRATSKHFGRDRRQVYRWIRAWVTDAD